MSPIKLGDNGDIRSYRSMSKLHPTSWLATGVVFVIATVYAYYALQGAWDDHEAALESSGISRSAFEAGWNAHCLPPPKAPAFPTHDRRNPRDGIGGSDASSPVVLRNAKLLNGDGTVTETDVAMRYGVFVKVPERLTEEWTEIDVKGRWVTPGLVDQHSHAGVDSWPVLWATSDTNEMTDSPLMPQLRSMDGFDQTDPAIAIINGGGVTTSLILPGSGNLMGGTGFVIKHRHMPSNLVEDMKIEANDPDLVVKWMKMACGENPKRFYGGKGQLPGSRLGSAWGFRMKFEKARDLLHRQQDWCESGRRAHKKFGARSAHHGVPTRVPEDLSLESLVQLLKGEVRLNVHCYEPNDLEMMVRNSHEFGFNITSFHHALSAWKVPGLLSRENISAAIFADNWGYKKEAYSTSVRAGKILRDAGVDVSYKSDHPVLNSQHLIYEAAKGHHYGMEAHDAIASVTSVPARKLGLDHRIGKVATGYDADVVVWNSHPLSLGAHPVRVFTDGYETFAQALEDSTLARPAKFETPSELRVADSKTVCRKGGDYTIVNIGRIHNDETGPIVGGKIVVKSGFVSCVGDCHSLGDEYDVGGGVATPGLIATLSSLGLSELVSEPSTQDGSVTDNAALHASQGTNAANGLRFPPHSRQLKAAAHAGVLTAVAVPLNPGVIQGHDAAFRVAAKDYSEARVFSTNNLHVSVGHQAKEKSTLAGSVSGQLQTLGADIFTKPVIVHTHEANDILRILGMPGPKSQLVIAGGVEAHRVSAQLAAKGAQVILSPARCTPGNFESLGCIVPGGSGKTRLDLLTEAGVNTSIAVTIPGDTRQLMWEAGWALADSKLDYGSPDLAEREAIGWVTWNAADAVRLKVSVNDNEEPPTAKGGRIIVGTPALFVVYDGSPVHFGTNILLTADGDQVNCRPQQD
ncbi:hypothetical protein HKX48_005520 [Thoreauomyces humboldtii]|nr:hypothetical protein HKX48_005520 [Thoreauomyces humboldtii]